MCHLIRPAFLCNKFQSFIFLSTPWTFTDCFPTINKIPLLQLYALESAVSFPSCRLWDTQPYPLIFFSPIPHSIHHTIPSSVSSASCGEIYSSQIWTLFTAHPYARPSMTGPACSASCLFYVKDTTLKSHMLR